MAQDGGTDRDSETLATYRTVEIGVAAVLLAFALLFLYGSYINGIGWGIEGPQSGFYPFYLSVIIAVCSAFTIFRTVRTPRGGKLEEAFVERGQAKRVITVLVPATLFVLGMQLVGIYIAGAVYIALFMRFVGKYPWWRSWLIAIVVIVALFFLFEVWFEVPLYKGDWNLTSSWTGY